VSHFSVLVVAKDENELNDLLLPYHEYECTGFKAYTKFVPIDEDTLNKYYMDESGLLEDDLDGDGYHQENGVWGRITNPNAKWDGWVIGGRWSGYLINVDGGSVDSDFVSRINFGRKSDQLLARRMEKYDLFHKSLAIANGMEDREIVNGMKPNDIYQWYESGSGFIEKARDVFGSAIDYFRFLYAVKDSGVFGFMWGIDDVNDMLMDRGAYKAKYENKPLTWAFIDQNGQWQEGEEMGWFGMSDNPQDDYTDKFWVWVDYIKANCADKTLYVVNCHI